MEGWSASLLLGTQPVSSLSHLAAASAALTATIPLVRLGRRDPGRTLALTIYAVCVISALGISGVYHSLEPGGAARLFMQKLDHCAIWCLIAGTFTGIHGIMWRGFWRGGLLAFVWTYAVVGIVLQIVWFPAVAGNLGLLLYLGLGWVGVLSIYKLSRQIGWPAALPLLYAGILYSAGALLDAFNWPVGVAPGVGPHEIFHFAVMSGVALHWLFIRKLLLAQGALTSVRAGAPGRPRSLPERPGPGHVPPAFRRPSRVRA
jgi:channel protein (hemolysin III family)